MLYAKFRNPKTFYYSVTPIETINIDTICMKVVPVDYVLGATKVRLFIDFCILKEVPKYQSSVPLQNQEMKLIPESVKRFDVDLTNEELANWNENDESLLQIVANKYNIEIESFFTY